MEYCQECERKELVNRHMVYGMVETEGDRSIWRTKYVSIGIVRRD